MNKDKYKILYLINGLGSGGAEMMLYRLLQRLDRSKFEPEVVTLLLIPGPVKENIEKLGIAVDVIGFKSKVDLISIVRLFKLLKARKPDILHTQLFASDILGRIIGRLTRIPVVISSIRNEYYGGWHRDTLIRLTENFAARTTAVSKAAARRLVEDRVVAEKNIEVIYNGVDPAVFFAGLNRDEKLKLRKELKLPFYSFLLLAVGSLTAQKGYEDLLGALFNLKAKGSYCDFKVIVAGSGPLRSKLLARVEELGVVDNIQFIGRSDEVTRLMGAADALVLTSHWEGLPGVVLEAMASALPVVANAVGGTPELVVDKVTGYLVPPGMPERVAEALEQLMGLTEGERRAMGLQGRNRVKELFHIDMMVANYENLYLDCLREKSMILRSKPKK